MARSSRPSRFALFISLQFPDSRSRIVLDTSPALALVAATGGLELLKNLYEEVILPREVMAEILAGGANDRGVEKVKTASGITHWPVRIQPVPLFSKPY
jgi:hypothetical protein